MGWFLFCSSVSFTILYHIDVVCNISFESYIKCDSNKLNKCATMYMYANKPTDKRPTNGLTTNGLPTNGRPTAYRPTADRATDRVTQITLFPGVILQLCCALVISNDLSDHDAQMLDIFLMYARKFSSYTYINEDVDEYSIRKTLK